MIDIQTLRDRRSSRRNFLQTAAVGALGLAGTGLLARSANAGAPAITDADILNFALNLEYLEAEYYTYAVTGNSIEALGISTDGSGTPGPVIIKPNPQVPFVTPAFQQYAVEIALDEQTHVVLLRQAIASLGAMPVARPTVDLLNSFNTLAQVTGLASSFDPFLNQENFLIGAYVFEDVGVTAYRGAAPLVMDKGVLSTAAGLLGTEAYHAGLLRTLLFQTRADQVTEAISNVRAALGGGPDYGVAQGPEGNGPSGNSSIILTDTNALTISRTTRQVLNIVYGAVDASSGLFFPDGVNGVIH